jgi:hypothetical protein
MLYRGWTIKAHRSFLGFSAQYISPMGLANQTGGSFATDQEAIGYAQALVDHLLLSERFSRRDECAPALAG